MPATPWSGCGTAKPWKRTGSPRSTCGRLARDTFELLRSWLGARSRMGHRANGARAPWSLCPRSSGSVKCEERQRSSAGVPLGQDQLEKSGPTAVRRSQERLHGARRCARSRSVLQLSSQTLRRPSTVFLRKSLWAACYPLERGSSFSTKRA